MLWLKSNSEFRYQEVLKGNHVEPSDAKNYSNKIFKGVKERGNVTEYLLLQCLFKKGSLMVNFRKV